MRFAILIASLFVACVFAGTALAVSFYQVGTLGPGGFGTTAGWNNRDYNRVCADEPGSPFTYLAAAGYYNSSNQLVYYTGPIWTSCGQGQIARLENNGYFKCRCWNRDTISFRIVCQTTP